MIFLVLVLSLFVTPAFAGGEWSRTKNIADDIIYKGKDRTFYCGCIYTAGCFFSNGLGVTPLDFVRSHFIGK